jgi:hypothetical protein
MSEDHQVLIYGPATAGERTTSGKTMRAGWMWTCTCGIWDDGYATEDDAEHGAEGDHADPMKRSMLKALRHRARHGRHLHHRDCIHNLPPEEQVRARGRSVEWWLQVIGPLPEQITPEQWECESPFSQPEAGTQ